MAERGNCRCCGNEYNINADGTVRYHLTDKAECQATPGSRKCSGVGEKPAGAEPEVAGQLSFLCRVPSGPTGCGHQVHLTANHRARSHLTPHGEKCAEGSSAPPIAVGPEGYRADTADWTEERWAEMLPAPKAERGGEVLPAAAPEDLRFGSEDAVEDFLGTGGPTPAERAAAAGDGRTAAQQEEIDRRMDDPVGSALIGLMGAEVGQPGTVLDALGFDPQDPDGPGEAPSVDPATAIKRLPVDVRGPAVDALFNDPRDDEDRAAAFADPGPVDAPIFDESHKITDESETEWVHPGPAEGCTMPECCTHPRGFEYVDDDNGHSGEFCPLCGSEPPAPCAHDYVAWDDLDDSGQERIVWACKHCGELEPWRTPADLLALMPADVQKLAAEDPRCWDCGHPVTPLADRFEADGSVLHVVWSCEPDCMNHETGDHYSSPCRPQSAAQCLVGQLDEGVLFVRHTAPAPVSSLVFRVQKVHPEAVESIVVSAGPYGGRTGSLTNLTEEITCTDLDGAPRPRRVSGPEAVRPTWKPQQPSSKAEATPTSSPTGTATDRSSKPGTTHPATRPTAPREAKSGKATPSGPTGTADTSTRSAPMTSEAQAAGDFLAAGSGSYGEAEARYGRWGRYRLTHPATGKTVEWTRATTFAKSISDTFTLSQWGKRNVLVGATLRPDIVAAAHGKDVSKDREQLNTWAEELEQAAGSKVAANLGTAVHSFTEAVDRRWPERWEVYKEIPNEFKPYIRAYILLLEGHGLEPVPHMIEFSTGVLQYEVMGTSDNCYRATRHLVLKMPRGEVRLSPGEHVIGDKKTGKDLSYGWQEICIQLALYAQGVNTQGTFNWADMTWDADPLSRFAEPGTKVREDVGVILHLPVDPRSDKNPAIYGVDLESGWSAAVLCERVRVWRKLRNLAGPVAVVESDPLADGHVPAAPAPAAVRPPTIWERAEAVTSKPEASAVYQDAVADKMPVADVEKLIVIMSERIAQVAEPGGAKV